MLKKLADLSFQDQTAIHGVRALDRLAETYLAAGDLDATHTPRRNPAMKP